jgi:hypothetical protein
VAGESSSRSAKTSSITSCEWKEGRLEDWKTGRVEGGKNGRVEEMDDWYLVSEVFDQTDQGMRAEKPGSFVQVPLCNYTPKA